MISSSLPFSLCYSIIRMGSIYMKSVMDVDNPNVGLVNIGAEAEKGNKLVIEMQAVFEEEILMTINVSGGAQNYVLHDKMT